MLALFANPVVLAVAGVVAAASYLYSKRADIAGWIGELKTPKPPDPGDATNSPEFRKRQAIREYNALLGTTSNEEPTESVCMPCLAASKAARRKERHDLIRGTQNKAMGENDPAKRAAMLAAADRLKQDMERVEDAKLALHTYTANEESEQPGYLKALRDQPPPGFKNPAPDQVAKDFNMSPAELERMTNDPQSSQRIMIYERDESVLGPGPKYTVAFRGSTNDARDWNNNGQNEVGLEAPHQAMAASLGKAMSKGAASKGKSIDDLVSATGHSKGGSEAQAFAAGSGSSARIFNPAGFDPSEYSEVADVDPTTMRIDRTTVVTRLHSGDAYENWTDPLYYAQHHGISSYVMKKPVQGGSVRELSPVDPNRSVPSAVQSDTEFHSMLQVVEALEKDKESDQAAISEYVSR